MTWFTLAEPVAPGRVRVLEAAGRRIAVCNAGGAYFAIDDVCTHDGGPLDQGELDGEHIECPRHGARFDVRTGRALSLPAIRPVGTYTTRAVGDTVEVEVP